MLGKTNTFLIPIAIILAGVLIAGSIFYVQKVKVAREKNLSPQEAAQKAIDYINQNKETLTGGGTASLVNVSDVGQVYQIRLKIGENEYESYATKDGKFLFTGGINIEEKPKTQEQPQTQKKLTCEDIKKSDNPSLEAFVVSKCPFGLQMQRILNEIIKNIPSLANNIKVEYIGAIKEGKITSMHGDEEAQENLRQICIREEEGATKYWSYIDCHIKKGEVDSCLSSANIDKTKVNACMTNNSLGLNYAQKDFDAQNKYNVTGSPTLFLNGEKVSEFDFGGRTAEAVKTLLCCGFDKKPEICSQKLTETSAATGFSETYGSSSGSSSGGGCE